MTNTKKKVRPDQKTTSVRIAAEDHAYLIGVSVAYGVSMTEAVGFSIHDRKYPITVVIRTNIIKNEAAFYTATLTVNEESDNLDDFYEGPTKAGASRAALDLIKNLGLDLICVFLEYRTEHLDDGKVIRNESVLYRNGRVITRLKFDDALAHGVLPAPRPRGLSRQAA